MASSLSQQLGTIRSQNADRIGTEASKARALSTSYLFPAKVAASQDLQTVYGLGTNGWEELCLADASLDRWASTEQALLLFGPSSKDLDRIMATKEENQRIDASISGFFARVGGYLLERTTSKCIEWLVRRFRINEFNVETTLSAFMPYHETPQFARMLQILKVQNKPHLAFLLPVRKRAVALPSSVLISTLLGPPQTTPALETFRWIASLPQTEDGVSASHALVAFWTSTIVKVCARWAGEASDDVTLSMGLTKGGSGKGKGNSQDNAQLLLSVILPVALDLSTSSSRGVEAQAAGCMVLSTVSTAFELSTDAARSIVMSLSSAKLTKGVDLALISTALSIAQSLNLTSAVAGAAFTTQAARNFAQRQGFSDTLRDICGVYRFDSALTQLCDAFVDALEPSDAGMTIEEKESIALLLEDVLDFAESSVKIHLCKRLLRFIAVKQRPELVAALARCRQRQPATIDEAVKQLASTASSKDKSAWTALSTVMAAQAGVAMKSSKSTKLWLGVNDASPEGRKVALEAMYASIDNGQTSSNDPLVKETVASRLSDDSILVLSALYSRPRILLDNLKAEAIAGGIASSMSILRPQDAQTILAHASFLTQHIAGSSHKADKIVLDALWPTLLFTEQSVETATEIVDLLSKMKKKGAESLLFGVASSIAKSTQQNLSRKNWQQINADVASAIAVAMNASDPSLYQQQVDGCVARLGHTKQGENVRSRLLATMVLVKLLEIAETDRRGRLAASILRNSVVVNLAELPEGVSTKALAEDFLTSTFSLSKPKHLFAWSQAILLIQVAHSVPLEKCVILGSNSNSDAETVARLYEIANSSSTGGTLSKELLQMLFSRMGEAALVFLANIWTTHSTPVLRFAALRHAQTFFAAFDGTSRKVDFQTILPSLFVALKSPEGFLRREAIACFKTLATTAAKEISPVDDSSFDCFGYDTLYGQKASENLKYLGAAEAKRLLDVIVEHAKALQHDAHHLDSLLRDTLTSKRGEAKADTKFRRAILSFLVSHIVAWGDLKARVILLEALGGVVDSAKLASYVPLLQSHVQVKANKADRELVTLEEAERDAYLGFLFGAFDRQTRQAIESDEDGAWTLFLQALDSQQVDIQKHAALSLRDNVFGILSASKSKQAYEVLLLCVSDPVRVVHQDARTAFSSLAIPSSTFISVVSELQRSIASSLSTGPQTKKARVSDGMSADDQTVATSERAAALLVDVLEAALSRKAETASGALVAELFEVLRVGTEMVFSRLGNADYLMQLSMSCLSMVLDTQSVQNSSSVEVVQSLRADTIVNVVKMSSNPQTFQQALLLLSTVARMAPDSVLHNAMPIFTFVGSTMLQRDDSFSFTVIEKTLRSILPPLIASIRKGMSGKRNDRLALLQESRSLLCVFTDAATHVPRHRRTIFFQLLVDIFGAEDFLSGICMLLVDRHARKVSKQSASEAQDTLALPLLVCQAYDASTQLNALNDIWAEVQRGYLHRNDDAVEARSHLFLDSLSSVQSEHSGHRLEPARRMLALLKFVCFASAQPGFAAKVEAMRSQEGSQAIDEPLGVFTQHAIQTSLLGDTEIQRYSREALDHVMSLASVETLAKVTKSLLGEGESSRRQSGLDLVADCLPELHEDSRREAASLLTPFVIETSYGLLWSKTSSEEMQLSCLAAVRAIVLDCDASEHNALSSGISGLIDLAKATTASIEVRQSSLQLITGLAKRLGPRIIPHLAIIVPTCGDLIDAAIEGQEVDLGVSATVVLTSLCQYVPAFMVGYIQTIVNLATREPIVRFLIGDEDAAYSKEANAFKGLLTTLGRYLPFDKILDATVALWQSATDQESNKYLHLACLDVLRRAMQRTKASRTTIAATYKPVFRFLLRVLDLRRTSGQGMSTSDFDEIETVAINVFMQLVLKLNESAFRPLFLRIHDWAALDLVDDDEDERLSGKVWDHGLCARRLVLYKVTNALLDRLKELVSSYYSTVLDLSLELLDAFSTLTRSSDAVSSLQAHERETVYALWLEVVSSLEKSAKYDHGRFWNPARFAKTIPKVVGQLTLAPVFAMSPRDDQGQYYVKKAEAAMTTRATDLLAQTISRLAKAVPDEASLKIVNSMLLTQSRKADNLLLDDGAQDEDEDEQGAGRLARQRRRASKIAALTTTTMLWSQESLSQTILGLVPETVPHISEMLDDDDEKVRVEVSRLVEAVEGVLGEPLDSYLQ